MTVARSAAGTAGPTAPAPGPAPAATNAPTGRIPALLASLRAGFEGTPGRLRGIAAITVLAAVLFGLAAGYSFRAADGALARAKANTDQLIRVQAIQNHVVQADADATNAFLVGGLEPAAQRADYTEADLLGITADRRGRAEPAGRRRGAGSPERRLGHLREHDRAGEGQQPPGTADRLAISQGRQRGAPRRGTAAAQEPGGRQQRARRGGVRQRCARCALAGRRRRPRPRRARPGPGLARSTDATLREPADGGGAR